MPQFHRPPQAIGLLVENLTDSRFADVWRGAADAARRHGVNLRCFCVGSLQNAAWMASNPQRVLCRLISTQELDGLLTLQWWREKAWFEQICRSYGSLPIVNIMRHFDGYPGVRIDNRAGMRQQLQHAVEAHGCRKIAYLSSSESASAHERFDAYREMLKHYNIPFEPALVVSGLQSMESEERHAHSGIHILLDERRLVPGTDIDAIATFSDGLALGAIEELQRRGIHVPYDVAVIGFNNQAEADFNPIPLTTVAIPWYDLGKQAANMLVRWRETGTEPGHQFVSPSLIVRRSCGCHEPETRHAGLRPPSSISPAAEPVAAPPPDYKARDTAARALTQVIPESLHEIRDWTVMLVEAFWNDLMVAGQPVDATGEFLRVWEDGLHQLANHDSGLNLGHELLSMVMAEFRRMPGISPSGREQVDSMCHQGRIVLHKLALRIQRRAQADNDRQNMIVRTIGQRLITTFDLRGLMDVLAEELPRLRIQNCWLALYDNPEEPGGAAWLLLSYTGQDRNPVPPDGIRFPAPQLMPPHLRPSERGRSDVVEALCFGERQLGFVVFGNGPRDGRLYQILRAEISSALQGALLIQELQRYRNHLEELVDERTAELHRSNEQLHQSIQERAKAEQALRSSEQQYRMLAENVKDGILIVQHGRIVFSNAVLAAMVGRTPESLTGGDPAALFRASDVEGQFWDGLLHGGHSGTVGQSGILTPDGRELWVEIESTPIVWNSQEAALLTIRNVTARKRKEQQLEDERARLQQENITLKSTIKERFRFGALIGKSAPMQQVYELIMSAAASDVNVLVVGESGTGKELIARTLHRVSSRREQAFVAVNCASIPETLFEREFFGHKRGAFTGADRDKPGLFDRAHQGVLFLDEVTELTAGTQAKLLRVLQDGEYIPLGSTVPKQADVLIVAATNKNPHEEIAEKRLRADFFYRICVIEVKLPALRERKDDLPLLVEHFLDQFREKQARKSGALPDGFPRDQSMLPGELMQALYAYAWPGNIRELQNILQRYLATRDLASVLSLMAVTQQRGGFDLATADVPPQSLADAVQAVEQRVIAAALAAQEYNVEAAARQLDLNPRTLYRKIKQYNLWKEKYR